MITPSPILLSKEKRKSFYSSEKKLKENKSKIKNLVQQDKSFVNERSNSKNSVESNNPKRKGGSGQNQIFAKCKNFNNVYSNKHKKDHHPAIPT